MIYEDTFKSHFKTYFVGAVYALCQFMLFRDSLLSLLQFWFARVMCISHEAHRRPRKLHLKSSPQFSYCALILEVIQEKIVLS